MIWLQIWDGTYIKSGVVRKSDEYIFQKICRKNVVKPRKLSAKASEKSLWSSGSRHAQLGKDFPRCRAVALYIFMKEPSLSSKLERWLFHVNVHGS